MSSNCKICEFNTNFFASTIVLDKYKVDYFQCPNCGFVQTEEPYWLVEAYSNVITRSDVGIVYRNNYCSQKASQIIFNIFDSKAKFLDYGGGYGLFVSIMRDLGFNFYWDDKFCQNILAQGFEINNSHRYELVTAFEVFEHFINPIEEIENILKFSRNILFSTEILPADNPKPDKWWYYAPHEGQHISIYTLKALSIIAEKHNLNFYSSSIPNNDISLHLLTEKKITSGFFENLCHNQLLAPDVLKNFCYGQFKKIKKVSLANNNKRTKIAFDISVLGLGYLYERAKTGVFRVVEYVLKGLIKSSQFDIYLCSSIPNLLTACEEYLRNEFQHNDLPLFTVSELKLQNISVYHSPFHPIPTEVNYCRKIVTVCDLIPIKFPEFFDYKEDSLIKKALKSITDNDFIICISESTKKDVLSYEKSFFDEQVFVTHLAADKNKFYACQDNNLINNIHQKYQIPKIPYLLSVCTLEPRKNLIHVIRCFLKLIQEKAINNLNLVLVGTRGWQYDEIFAELNHNTNLRQRIIFTGFVPDEDLAPLYSNALAFLYLSLYEGFGLPPLEAMQCGTPVITSNTSSLPEVVGEAGIMLSPNDVGGLCDAIFELYIKPDMREALSLKSLKQSEKFTWEKTLQETINVYKLAAESEFSTPSPKIIIDGIFFQLSQNGIARVWKSLLEEWANQEFGKHLIVLDRAGTAPKIPGIRYRTVHAYNYNTTVQDREMLQQVCDEEKADLFISTYYTTPLSTPSVFMAYDMIPELLGEKLNIPMWQEKHYGINHASAYITISESTARDLHKLFPHTSSELVTVASCGIQNIFSPANYEEINQFKAKYNISKPYFVLVGDRVGVNGYKNTSLFFDAFSQIPNSQDFEIVCVGSQTVLEPQLRAFVPDATVHLLKLDDSELRIAYSGAIALVYPSKYEGFGLPVLEAMTCGCPVLTCPNGSIPEVGGEAVLYVNSDDVDELIKKLFDVQQLEVRQSLIAAGLEQAKKFSWLSMAEKVSKALLEAVDLPPKKWIDTPISIKELTSWIEQYQKDLSNSSAIEKLRQARKQLADLWLELPTEEIAIAYRSEIGKTHKLLLESGIRNEQLTDSEQAFVTNLLSHIDEKLDNPKAIQYLLALMQYRYASELSVRFDLNSLPYWLLQDYLGFMLFSPTYFQETGEANSYYHYLEQFINFIYGNISSNPDSQLWQNVANYFAEKANFIPLYFNEDNLKGIYQKRAEIIEVSLKNRNLSIEHEFIERSPQKQKIRLGILVYHFGVQTETFANLPIYKYLNRDLFEVILFPIKMSNHRLERYCAGHSDELVILPNNLQEQVETIREADLDVLFISTNVTAVTNQITLLASHRTSKNTNSGCQLSSIYWNASC